MHSKKGYVSFLFFSLLSILILSISLQTQNTDSLSPAYNSKIAFDNHVYLKHSLKPAAKEALTNAQTILKTAQTLKKLSLTTSGATITTQKLTTKLEDDTIRLFTLQKFLQITAEYSKLFSSNSKIYCVQTTPAQIPVQFSIKNQNLATLWGQCSNKIEIIHSQNKTTLKITDGFYLQNTNADIKSDSKILPFEVES